jgi:putative toxin-antitoxin system antitoxin component (TIGR02293 family)
MQANAVANMLGGIRVFGGEIHSELQLFALLNRGLPSASVASMVAEHALTREEVDQLILPWEEFRERHNAGMPLDPEQSDKLARIARIIALAEHVFGNKAKAARWLRKPNRVLGGDVPLLMLERGEGAVIVEQSLMQVAFGGVA